MKRIKMRISCWTLLIMMTTTAGSLSAKTFSPVGEGTLSLPMEKPITAPLVTVTAKTDGLVANQAINTGTVIGKLVISSDWAAAETIRIECPSEYARVGGTVCWNDKADIFAGLSGEQIVNFVDGTFTTGYEMPVTPTLNEYNLWSHTWDVIITGSSSLSPGDHNIVIRVLTTGP